MPSVKLDKNGRRAETQQEYMQRCVPMMVKEGGKSQDQSVAACLNMYKNKWQSKGSSDNSDGLNTLKDKNPVKISPTSNPTREQSQGKNNLNKNMKTNEQIKNELPNPIKGTKIPGKECSEAKYGIEMTPNNKDNTGCASEFKGGMWIHSLDIRESKVSAVDWSKRPLQLTPDGKSNRVSNLVRNESNASYHSQTKCDNCGKTIRESNSNGNTSDSNPNRGEIYLGLKNHDGSYSGLTACSEACMLGSLMDRHKKKKELLEQELQKHKDVEEKVPFFQNNEESKASQDKKKTKSGIEKVKSIHDGDDLSINSDQTFKDSSAALTEKEKREHHHNNKPYGDVTYADPKNHKYPINNEKHVRAALSYINHPKNAAEYSPSELAAIKGRIHQAAKRFGIKVADEK